MWVWGEGGVGVGVGVDVDACTSACVHHACPAVVRPLSCITIVSTLPERALPARCTPDVADRSAI